MKKYIGLMVVLGMVGSVSAFARGNWGSNYYPKPTDSWEVIQANWNVKVKQTSGAEVFGIKGFFDACVDGENFRSLTPRKVCVASHWVHENGGGGQEGPGGTDYQVCDQYENQYVTLPITSTQQVCTKYSYQNDGGGQESGGGGTATCVEYRTYTVNLPVSPTFSVVHITRSGGQESGMEEVENVLFKKTYDIPACN